MLITIDLNRSAKLGRTSPLSSYFTAASESSPSVYEVTINFDTGHFCTCRGHLSKVGANKRKGLKMTGDGTANPFLHCKHVRTIMQNHDVLEAGMDARAERRAMAMEIA